MILWVLFIFIIVVLCFIYDNNNIAHKKVALFSLTLVITYFSGFRDGLGVDYQAYKDYNSVLNFQNVSFFLSEPFYLYLSRFIYNSSFSYVLFFVLMSLITTFCSLNSYKRYNNLLVPVFVFILFPSLFMTSFTLVRSTAAASLGLYAVRYLENQNKMSIFWFLLLISFAFTIHKSSAIFLIFLFLNSTDFKNFAFVLLGILISFGLLESLFSNNLLTILDFFNYSSYYEYDEMSLNFYSSSILFLHLFLIPLFYYRKKILNLKNSSMYIIPIKGFILALFFSHLSSFFLPISYRLFYSFMLFFPIVFLLIFSIIKIPVVKFIMIFLILLIGFKSLIYGIDNPLVISDTILSPFNLFD